MADDKSVHWFWKESVWLPLGYKWTDYESTPTLQKADLKSLYYLPFYIVLLSMFRYVFEWFIAKPICSRLGIKDDRQTRSKICEYFYETVSKFPKSNEIESIAKETNMTSIEVAAWFRKRRKFKKTSLMSKSMETCWRSFAYFVMFTYGTVVLIRNRDWFLDHSKWLPGYIKHPFTFDIKVYYFMEMSFYFSLLFTQFTDTKRKDFAQQFVHHITTLTLLLGSYIVSLYRFGTIIMYIHDAADFWLETAKLCNYAKIQKVCDVLFGIFALVFFATRIIYYPGWVAYAYFHYNTDQNSIVFQTLVCLCFLLLFLNFYWGYLVLRLAWKLIVNGDLEKDSRSDSEEEEEKEEEGNDGTKKDNK